MDDKCHIYGVYKRELKNRFLCIVEVNGEELLCYQPISCKLSNFLDPVNKLVILIQIMKKNSKTKFAVYAIKIGREFILVNFQSVNKIFVEQIKKRKFKYFGKRNIVHTEKFIDTYKADVYLEESRTIIEIKTIISFEKNVLFPNMDTERFIKQLNKMQNLLENGYGVCLIFAILSSKTKEISFDINNKKFYDLFQRCLEFGMVCKGYYIKGIETTPYFGNEIPMRMGEDNDEA